MTVTFTRHSQLVLISAALTWLVISAGTGWYFYSQYRFYIQPDPAKLEQAAVQLDTAKLTQALNLLSGN